MLMDIVDDFLGRIDLIDELSAPLILRSFRIVKIRVPRTDKSPDSAPYLAIIDHLKDHGVDAAPGGFDRNELSLYVRESQASWARWLLRLEDDANSATGRRATLHRARTRWSEQRAARRQSRRQR